MALETQALLTAIEEAITALLSGDHQSYSIGSRSVTRLDLKSLMEERRILKSEVAAETGCSVRLAKFGRPRT